ncbi:MAG: protein translocase subunit SecD, partial [Gammaproteobacteria bacterium]|nr:protein translocase subunit SecD [Gammaproteobacteria bacterium]
MNRYPLWKYILVLVIVLTGFVYALPNIYGEYPAVQISPTRTTQVDQAVLAQVEDKLKQANISYSAATLDEQGARIRFADTEIQIRARDLIQRALGDNYVVALNLLPATPAWLAAINARPMYLGLDLRGGVHFLMQVDTLAVFKKTEENYTDDMRRLMREKRVQYLTVSRLERGGIEIRFREEGEREKGVGILRRELPDLEFTEFERSGEFIVRAGLKPATITEKGQFALEQNITSLQNRVNELGVAEPIIQQQGQDRIVVQLPGVQDTARAKEILGRTATLEIMLVDEEHELGPAVGGQVPVGSKLYKMRDGRPILLKNRLIYSGDNIIDSAPGFDNQQGSPIVSITLDARGAAINQRVTGENVGKRMAVIYIEIRSETRLDDQGRPVLDAKGRPVRVSRRVEEVITAPVIRSQLGKRFQIEGLDSVEEANELSLLLRAGAFAAPVQIIEERTVGPSLGAENIAKGFNSIWAGFAAIVLFMIIYYVMVGFISAMALAVNLLLLVALLSIMQATLTLPGMAAIALTVGMAIDANVLINERIREELRNGNTPQASIFAGYERAFGTIL